MGAAHIDWTRDLEDEICGWIAEGKTLREFCRQDGKPSYPAVYDRQIDSEEFKKRITCAREIGEDQIAQECLQIADTTQPGQIITDNPDGSSETRTGDMLGHRKLQIETRLKLLAKWNPRKYGDKVQVGGDPSGVPIQSEVTVKFVDTGAK